MADSGTMVCECAATVGKIPCQCTESQYFVKKPKKFVCDDCVQGKHKVYGF